MSDVLKMDYPQAEEMIQIMMQAANQLEDISAEMQSIAQVLENGALLGDAGDAFSMALRSRLVPAIGRLRDGIAEGADYVRTEKEDMEEAERRSAGLF